MDISPLSPVLAPSGSSPLYLIPHLRQIVSAHFRVYFNRFIQTLKYGGINNISRYNVSNRNFE